MDTTGKPVEDDTCAKYSEKDPDHTEEDGLKQIWYVTADRIIWLTQDLVMFTKKRNTWGHTQEECVLPGSK